MKNTNDMKSQKKSESADANQQYQDEVNKLKVELEKAKKETEENKNKYLRALADYQNLEKKVLEERTVAEKWAVMKTLLKLMPVVNNIKKAEVFVKDPGLKLVKEDLEKLLSEMGVTKIEVMGQEFDPAVAEAVDIVAGDRDNIVVEVLRDGYRLDERILQIAQVKVSKKVENKN